MSPEDELRARKEALDLEFEEAKANGFTKEQAANLGGILPRHVNAFWQALRGDSPAMVEPMGLKLDSDAHAAKALPWGYDPAMTTWLARLTAAFIASVFSFLNLQGVWVSPAF